MPRFTPGCCCASAVDCIIGDEVFSVIVDTTTVGGWTELVGDWELTSGVGLEPDRAVSNQRIRFDTPSADLDCEFWTYFSNATSGDCVGVCLFLDADGDSFVRATLEFGSGTSGRASMSRFDNGVLTWTQDSSVAPRCGTNEYDFDPAGTYSIGLSHRVVAGGRIWRVVVTDTTTSYDIVDYFDTDSIGGLTAFYGGLVTGTDAATVSFHRAVFRYVYAGCECHVLRQQDPLLSIADGPASDRGDASYWDCFSRDPCDHPGAEYEEDVGDWDIEDPDFSNRLPWRDGEGICGKGNWLATEDVPARLLLRHLLRAPCAHGVRIDIGLDSDFVGHVDGLIWRWLWDYVDEDNYWCVEWEYGDWDGTLGADCDSVRVIERSSGSETTQAEISGILNRFFALEPGTNGAIAVNGVLIDSDGYVAVGVYDFRGSNPSLDDVGWFCSGPFTFTGAAHVGVEVVAAPQKFVVGLLDLIDGAGACEYSAQCETFVTDPPEDPDPPEEPDPEDPTGCCDTDPLAFGDEYEITISDITYFTGLDCLLTCLLIDSAWIAAFNSTFTGRTVWKSAAYWEIRACTGIDNPCDGLTNDAPAGAMWVSIRIEPVSDTHCQAFGAIFIPIGGSCGVAYYESTLFTKGDACTSFNLDWVSGSLNGCCLNATGGSSLAVVKV